MGKEILQYIHDKYNLFESKTWICNFLKVCKQYSCPIKPTKTCSFSSFLNIIMRSSFLKCEVVIHTYHSLINLKQSLSSIKRKNKYYETNNEIGLNMYSLEKLTGRIDKHRKNG